MIGSLIVKNHNLLGLIQNENSNISDFIDIILMLRKISHKVYLDDETVLGEIYEEMFNSRTKEEVRILSKLFEKIFCLIGKNEHLRLASRVESLIKTECNSFELILNNKEYFNFDETMSLFSSEEKQGVRIISNIIDLKQLLLIFSTKIHDPYNFIEFIKPVFSNMIFDNDILDSMSRLSSGFLKRINEIVFHLYIIDLEVPNIVKIYSDYRSIGNHISIDCSPERSRETVEKYLKTTVNGVAVNCELHTKMKTLSSTEADRIYFCPALPSGIDKSFEGKIFIYKITKHV